MEKSADLSTQENILATDGIPATGPKAGTLEDQEAMRRLGKEQLFKVFAPTNWALHIVY